MIKRKGRKRPRSRFCRIASAAAGIALAGGTLSACTSASAGTGPVALNFYLYPDTSGATNMAISNCNAQSGGKYTISYQMLPQASDGQRQQLVRRLAAHDPSIDIMGLDVTWEAEFAEAGWIVPWTGSNKAQAEDGTLKPALQTATWQGQLVAVPDNTNTQLLWYRSDLVPNPPTTWAQMIADAEQLAKEGKPHYIEIQGAQYEGATVWLNTMVTSAGGSILNASASGPSMGAPAVKALSIMKQLADSPAADPSLSVQMENQNRLAMEAGTAAFELNYPFVYPSMKMDNPTLFKSFKWAPYPSITPGVPAKVTIGGVDLAVGAYSQHKDLAFQAALCLRDKQNQLIGANGRRRPADDRQPVQRPGAVRRLPVPRRHPVRAPERERPPADPVLPGGLHRPLAPDLAADQDQPGGHRAVDGQPDQRRSRVQGPGPVSRRRTR